MAELFPSGPDMPCRSREFLRSAETQAISIRDLLQNSRACKVPGSRDDALKLAVTIERLARYGLRSQLDAAAATTLCEQIQLLMDQLVSEMDDLFAS